MFVAAPSLRWRACLLALVVVFVVACSSGGADEEPEAGSGGTSEAGASSGAGADGVLPLGVAWEATVLGRFEGHGRMHSMAEAGGQIWALGNEYQAPVGWRSSDGLTWTETEFPFPSDAGDVTVFDIVELPDGRLVGAGNLATECRAVDGPGEFTYFDRCHVLRPTFHISDDGGESWRRVDPTSMAPPAGASQPLLAVAVHGGALVAVSTVRGPDWHGRVWTSSDGEDWSLASEVRGDDPWSVDDVLSDGDSLVVLASAHPCSTPTAISEAGWVLGTAWPRHLRILAGPDARALSVLAPGEHPLAAAPMDADCAEVGQIEFATRPYARADGAVIDGIITLIERSAEGDDRGADLLPRRVVSLVDDSWQTASVDLPTDLQSHWLVRSEMGVAMVTARGHRTSGLGRIEVSLPDGGGSWAEASESIPVLSTRLGAGIGFGGAILATGILHDEPFDGLFGFLDPGEFVVWRSTAVSASEWHACALEPGASCASVDLEQVGASDLSGRDLAGIDLTLADLGSARFDGANLSGARLVAADSVRGSFVGADLSGADLRVASLGDLAGADLSDADLAYGRFGFSGPPLTLEGANLVGATLRAERVDGEFGTLELSLAGLDLTNVRVDGPFDVADPRIVVTDLRGAVIDNTTFSGVDLTNADVTGVDLSGLRIDEDSFCPGGEPPVMDGSFGTCE